MALTNNMGSLGPLRSGTHPLVPALWAPEPDFHSANVVGTTFEGSLKTFLRDLDGVGESFVAIFYQEQL